MVTAGLQLKMVVEATRGAVIAVHAAGGLARGNVQALRLLRAAEGLCRTAVSVLQIDEGKKKDKGKGQKDTDKDKGKDSDVGMGVTPPEPGAQPRRRRRGRARGAAAHPAVDLEFDDRWADGVVAAPLGLPGDVVPPHDEVTVQGRRPLIARRSGSRTPPRNISPRPRAVEPSAAAASAPPLLAGRVATIIGLVSRPELDNVLVVLDVQDKTSGRWICRVKGGEQLRLLPVRLVPIAETGQQFSRLRYDAS
jgi:hypothetical protein